MSVTPIFLDPSPAPFAPFAIDDLAAAYAAYEAADAPTLLVALLAPASPATAALDRPDESEHAAWRPRPSGHRRAPAAECPARLLAPWGPWLARQRTTATGRAYERDLRRFLAWAARVYLVANVEEITAAEVSHWALALAAEGRAAPESCRRRVRSVRRALDWAERVGAVPAGRATRRVGAKEGRRG